MKALKCKTLNICVAWQVMVSWHMILKCIFPNDAYYMHIAIKMILLPSHLRAQTIMKPVDDSYVASIEFYRPSFCYISSATILVF